MAVESPPITSDSLAGRLKHSYVAVRNDLEISRHVFFGEISYVVRDPVSFDGHSFTPVDYEILTSLQESKSLGEVFASLVERGIVETNQENDFYAFVVELQKQNLLNLPIADAEAMYQQFQRRRQARAKNLFMKIVFLRVPIGSPDRFLKSTYHLVSFLFSWTFFRLWVICLVAALGVIIVRWDEFIPQLASSMSLRNLPMILLVMAVLKIWHELGHGYACRRFNVSVPTAGLMFVVGTPLAFVDASGSWSLSQRKQRQIINLAGIYFELMIAMLAAFVWAFSDAMWIKSLSLFVLLVSSVTTIGFNINPLMKFDGYFVLADWLGIPNLRSRSTAAIQAFAKSVFLGIRQPAYQCASLRLILISYGLAAALYKIVLVTSIATMMALKIWIVGVLVGAYYVFVSFGSVILKTCRYLWCDDELGGRRKLATAYIVLLLIGIPSVLLFCPVPGDVRARGVADHEIVDVVRLADGGFLKQLQVDVGQRVKHGDSLARLENIDDSAQWKRRRAELAQLQLKYRSVHGRDNVESGKTAQEIDRLEFELENSRVTAQTTSLLAAVDGQIVSCSVEQTLGGYLAAGDELMRVGNQAWVIRAVANSQSMANINAKTGQHVFCRFNSEPGHVYRGRIKEISVSGSREIKHESLTHLAGGWIVVDPATMKANEPFFDLTIQLDDGQCFESLRYGSICEVRFERSYESLGQFAYRALLRFVNKIHLK